MLKTLLLCILFTPIFSRNLSHVCKILPPNPVILDCGANNGQSSIQLAKEFPNSTVLAVEADPRVYKILKDKVKISKNIIPFNIALSNKNGVVSFYPNKNIKQSHAQGSLFPHSKSKWYWKNISMSSDPIKVESKTLDDFCSENDLSEIHFLYLDMQGGEYQMIDHSKTIMSNVRAIYIEVLFEQIYEHCPLYPDVVKLLDKFGFKQLHLWKRHKSYGDALFIRKDYL